MKNKEKRLITLIATFTFAMSIMLIIVLSLAKENDNQRRKIDALENHFKNSIKAKESAIEVGTKWGMYYDY